MKKYNILIVIFILIGCKTLRVDIAYKGHFEDKLNSILVIDNSNPNYYPNEITESLPLEFQMAKQIGYLTVIIDGKGFLKTTSNYKKPSIKHSTEYLIELNKYPSSDYKYFYPVGYPHITAIMPRIDITEAFDIEMSQNWLRFLDNLYENKESLESIIDENNKLVSEIVDLKNTSTNLSNQIKNGNNSITKIKSEITKLDNDIANLNSSKESLIPIDIPNSYYGSLPKTYSFENDPFRKIYEDNFQNIENSIPNEGLSNPYLHSDMAAALIRVNDVLNNPSQHFVPQIAQEISDANLTPITLNSASRSVLHQASLTASTRASYLNSLHALGVAVDLKFTGTNYDVRTSDNPSQSSLDNYNKLLFVLNYCGIVRSTRMDNVKERNHFSLSSFSKYDNGQSNSNYSKSAYLSLTTKMFGQFQKVANENLTSTLTSIEMFTSNQNQLISKAAKLSTEIDAKKTKLTNLKATLDALSKTKKQKQVQKQKIIEKKEREAQAERDRENVREHLREMRERQQREREIEREREHRDRDRERRDRERERRERERDRNPPGGDICCGGLG